MIVIEEVLEALFSQIPERTYTDANDVVHTTPAPKYFFGDMKEANTLISKMDSAIYPLIYQTSIRFEDTKEGTRTDLDLILATRTKATLFNTQRWATSYRNILLPLYEDVKACLEQSNVIFSEWQYRDEVHPNYGETEERNKNKFVDIVDALKVNVSILITKGCVNKSINFKR